MRWRPLNLTKACLRALVREPVVAEVVPKAVAKPLAAVSLDVRPPGKLAPIAGFAARRSPVGRLLGLPAEDRDEPVDSPALRVGQRPTGLDEQCHRAPVVGPRGDVVTEVLSDPDDR